MFEMYDFGVCWYHNFNKVEWSRVRGRVDDSITMSGSMNVDAKCNYDLELSPKEHLIRPRACSIPAWSLGQDRGLGNEDTINDSFEEESRLSHRLVLENVKKAEDFIRPRVITGVSWDKTNKGMHLCIRHNLFISILVGFLS